jgi:hypothetical protein
MRIGNRSRTRQTWLSILPVLPYLILALTAGGLHQHLLLSQYPGERAAESRVGPLVPQAGESPDGRCAACDWLAQSSVRVPAAPPPPHPICLEDTQLVPLVPPIVPTPLTHSSRAPPLV